MRVERALSRIRLVAGAVLRGARIYALSGIIPSVGGRGPQSPADAVTGTWQERLALFARRVLVIRRIRSRGGAGSAESAGAPELHCA
jgi:hypothetical protein